MHILFSSLTMWLPRQHKECIVSILKSSLSLSLSLSLYVCVCLSLCVCVCVCVCLSLSLSIFHANMGIIAMSTRQLRYLYFSLFLF